MYQRHYRYCLGVKVTDVQYVECNAWKFFNRHILFDLKYEMDRKTIHLMQKFTHRKDNHSENSKRRDFTYTVGAEVNRSLHILRKTNSENGACLFSTYIINKERLQSLIYNQFPLWTPMFNHSMSVNPTDMVRIILCSPTSTKGHQQMHTQIS